MHIDLIPLKSAVICDEDTILDVLIRVTPPAPEVARRPKLNLALVLDRSGSMGGHPLRLAVEAAKFAVRQLTPKDHLSVTIFDSTVQTVVPSRPVTQPDLIAAILDSIEARGSTDLHGGWRAGAEQASAHRQQDTLNRVLLLTDGQANIGLTNPDAIASAVRGAVQNGVSTSALGLGLHYNEQLLETMANAGDGNYFFVEHPDKLPEVFAAELAGLSATLGHAVSLGIELGEGAQLVECLNDFERTDTKRFKLPNLLVGRPIEAVFRLRFPARRRATVRARLAWTAPGSAERRVRRETLDLPATDGQTFAALPEHPEVARKMAELHFARAQREAALRLDRGNVAGARDVLTLARDNLSELGARLSVNFAEEFGDIDALEERIEAGEHGSASKLAKARSYEKRTSRRREGN